MRKPAPLERKHFTYELLREEYLATDSVDEGIKMGYAFQHGRQKTPDNVEYYSLADGSYVAIAIDYEYDDSHYTVFIATPETDEDREARVARQEAAELKAKELRAQETALKKLAKSQELDKAKKALEKAGFKVTK